MFTFSKLIDDTSAHEIYDKFVNTNQSKSSLGREYGVDAKTISRIIEKIEALNKSKVSVNTDQSTSVYPDSSDFEDTDNDSDDEVVEELNVRYNFVLTSDSIAINRVTTDSEGFSVENTQETITKGSEKFQQVFDRIMESRGDQQTLEECYGEISTKIRTEKFFRGRLTIDPAKELATFKMNSGNEIDIPAQLTTELINKIKERNDKGFEALCNFTERLFSNPSFRAVNQLFGFIKAKCIDIDDDGYLICFKKVGHDYKDLYSGTFDNSPGQTVSIDRNQVDEDPNRTCSKGLHVCSSSYLPHYANNTTSRIVRVKVDPKDFVAVPTDYNDAKARVCAYYVINDVTSTFR